MGIAYTSWMKFGAPDLNVVATY